MADNKFFNNQKIYVETDYENIIVIDPNKVVNADDTVSERLVNHEELVMYANLEAKIIPRSKLVVGSNYEDTVQNLRVGAIENDESLKVNFLKPKGKEYLDTSWTDELTGKDSLVGGGLNQTKLDVVGVGENRTLKRRTINNVDTQLLGIESISIKINTRFVPEVTIEMVDVQGRTLFEQGEDSPYSAFMQLPYPLFTLTIKGYMGKAIRYELMLKDFNARFDASDGNYKITTNFIARTFAILSDITLKSLYALPHMYHRITEVGAKTTTTANTRGINNRDVNKKTSTRGMESIDETYLLYKEKGLIEEDFPHLTLNQMIMKLDRFEKYVMDSYGKEDMAVLNDIAKYENLISEYRDSVFGDYEDNWYTTYIDESNAIVLNDVKQSVIYPFKNLNLTDKKNGLTRLETIIKDYNKKLNSNTTFGESGQYEIDKKVYESSLSSNISIRNIKQKLYSVDQINIEKTYELRSGNAATDADVAKLRAGLESGFEVGQLTMDAQTKQIKDEETDNLYFSFGQYNGLNTLKNNSFLKKLQVLDDKFKKIKEKIEKQLSESLAKKISSKENGLGFNPTMNNVMAVICASVDGFFRLMDKIHEEAWEQRKNPIRMSAILDSNKSFGVDSKDSTKTVTPDGKLDDFTCVYPWPQYFEIEIDEDGNESYVDKYPGDPSVVNSVQGYLFDVWPEIKFVEEFIKGSVQIEEQEIESNYPNQIKERPYVSSNAIEFPFTQNPYINLSKISFFYELYERSLLASNYTGLHNKNGYNHEVYTVLGEFETLNVKESITDAYPLMESLKNMSYNYDNYMKYLESIAKYGKWNLLVRDEYTTDYIKSNLQKDSGIYSLSYLNDESVTIEGGSKSIEKLKNYITSTNSNETSFMLRYPFNSIEWLNKNLSQGNDVVDIETFNNTTKSYKFLESKKTLSTFSMDDSEWKNKPITYFKWIGYGSNGLNGGSSIGNTTITTQLTSNEQAKLFFNNRTQDKLGITESFIDYGSKYDTTKNNITSKQTTSLLNTPYFVNALLDGISKHKQGNNNPYTSLGYLYLNSLPLSTLREKLKTYENEITSNGDYIAASLNKFSAIHKLPYAWVLKYGSIWYRYKNKITLNVDILDDVWKDFDYKKAYDPNGSNTSKQYNVKLYNDEDYSLVQNRVETTTYSSETVTKTYVENGFYPKVINDLYWYFTKKDLISNYTTSEISNLYNNNFKSGKVLNGYISTFPGQDIDNPNETDNLNSWFQYFNLEGNTDFNYEDRNKVLIIPSCGYPKFNQPQFECYTSYGQKTQSISENNSITNGSVRCLWDLPNYGYFNSSYIAKPRYNEYIKYVDPNKDNKQSFNLGNDTAFSYSSIDDLFGVFTKEMLDEFEKHFLNFCKPIESYNPKMVNRGEVTFEEFLKSPFIVAMFGEDPSPEELTTIKNIYQNDSPTFGEPVEVLTKSTNIRDYSLHNVLRSIFLVNKPEITGNANNDAKNISSKQITQFTNVHSLLYLIDDIVLKIGNPQQYDRKTFNSFSNETTINPVDKIDFGKFEPTTITQNTDAIKALSLYVGDYGDTGMISNSLEFFQDFDIEFNENNVKLLSPLIKVYIGKKENDGITPEEFMTEFNDYLKELSEFQKNILNHIFVNLNRTLPDVKTTESNYRISKLDGNINKLALWKTFQAVNDKWVSGQDFKTRTIFEDFLFLDRANRPIGDKIIVDIEDLRNFVSGADEKTTLWATVTHILGHNNFAFIPTPAYTNFYGRDDRIKEGGELPQDIPNDMFGTFMEVDTRDSRPKLVAIYTGEPSKHLDMKNDKNNRRLDDSFDLVRASANPLLENQTNKTNYSDSNRCVGFNVDFGTRNQGVFKSMSLDMNQHKNIAPTYEVLIQLGSQASGQKVAQQTQSLYNFYATRSYTCNITAIGNAMIQPTMYFNLRHVPMFTGPYYITGVQHTITSRDFTTQFQGTRISRYSLPNPDKLVASVNIDVLKKYQKVLKNAQNNTDETETNNNNTENKQSTDIKSNSDEISPQTQSQCQDLTKQPNIEFVDISNNTVSRSEVKNYIYSISDLSEDMKIFLIGLGMERANTINVSNYNIYGVRTDFDWNAGMLSFIDNQICVKYNSVTTPMASFNTLNRAIDMWVAKYKPMQDILNSLKPIPDNNSIDNRAKAMTNLQIYSQEQLNGTPTQIKENINNRYNTDNEYKTYYDNLTDMFKSNIIST